MGNIFMLIPEVSLCLDSTESSSCHLAKSPDDCAFYVRVNTVQQMVGCVVGDSASHDSLLNATQYVHLGSFGEYVLVIDELIITCLYAIAHKTHSRGRGSLADIAVVGWSRRRRRRCLKQIVND